jgi:two-component system, sensor histidine kinase LadS
MYRAASSLMRLLTACGLLAWSLAVLSLLSLSGQAIAQAARLGDYQLPGLFASDLQLNLEEPMGVLVLPRNTNTTVDQVAQTPLAEQFMPWRAGMQLPTSPVQEVWLRLQLPQQERPQSWMLRVPRLTLEKATVFQRSPSNPTQWLQQSAGLSVPNSSWPVRARDPIFEISTRSDQTQLFFIRLQNPLPVTENIQLIHSSEFGNGANYAGTLNGVIIGVFFILTLLSLVSWHINRNTQFAWFALFCLSVMLSQLTVSGYMYMRIWSDSPYLAKTMGWVMPLLSMAALARFSLSVSYARDLSKPIYYGLWGMIALCILLSIGLLAMPNEFPRAQLNTAYAVGMLAILGSLSWIAWRSQHWLWMIVASIVPLILSVLARLAYNQGLVAHMELALLAGVITAGLGLLSIYAALVLNQRQRIASSQREDAIETIDGSTGLLNERIALARLPQIILRSKRFDKSCGVVMLRWVDCEKLMSRANAVERGRMFVHFGNRLNRLARDIDTVARIGDDLFVFLVEAPISREQLSSLASHILTTCMRPSPALPDNKGFDLHMALWLSNQLPSDAPTVLELLKTRINQMREGTQRRVQFIDSPLSTAPSQDQIDPLHGKKLVEKINALEATHGLPTIHLTAKVDKPD